MGGGDDADDVTTEMVGPARTADAASAMMEAVAKVGRKPRVEPDILPAHLQSVCMHCKRLALVCLSNVWACAAPGRSVCLASSEVQSCLES